MARNVTSESEAELDVGVLRDRIGRVKTTRWGGLVREGVVVAGRTRRRDGVVKTKAK
jgi:hypothetical protein